MMKSLLKKDYGDLLYCCNVLILDKIFIKALAQKSHFIP